MYNLNGKTNLKTEQILSITFSYNVQEQQSTWNNIALYIREIFSTILRQ